jgi:hypothetical protein
MSKVNHTKVWEFIVTDNMISHLNPNELSLFITAMEDSIEEICGNYNVEPWEMSYE